MKKPSQTKAHLTFYGGAILFVLALFQLTTAYGEANLQAPPNINGRYLTSTALPGCPNSSRLIISIQQSGRYLNGGLQLASPTPTHSPVKYSLNGLWQQQLTLNGQTTALSSCEKDLNNPNLNIVGTVSGTPAVLAGKLTMNAQPWSFTATKQPEEVKNEAH
jgi:hypothetical protein